MALLELIGAGAGLLQGLNQNRQAERQQRRVQDLYADIARRSRQDYQRSVEFARQMQASGFGDSKAQEALIDADFDDAERRSQGNLLAASGAQGRDPLDTPVRMGGEAIARSTGLQRLKAKKGARDAAYEQMFALQPLYSQAGMNAADASYANAIWRSPLSQPQDLSGVFNSFVNNPTLQPRRGRFSEATPFVPTDSSGIPTTISMESLPPEIGGRYVRSRRRTGAPFAWEG